MLRQLKVSNLAILPELSVTFSEGLNVLTGETGAGKSILVDAIALLAGKRASADDVRAGEEMAIVEGVIEASADSLIWKAVKDLGVPSGEGQLILRRTISVDGRSRAYVNDWSWTVSGLAQIARYWLDLSSQHGQQRLLAEEEHTASLDEFGRHESELQAYSEVYQLVRACDDELEGLRKARDEAARQRDFLLYQSKELESAQLRKGEEEELTAAHRRLANGEKLARAVETMETLLSSDDGIESLSGKLANELRAAGRFDPSLAEWQSEFDEVSVRLRELNDRIGKYRRSLEFEPAEVERIEERIARLQAIARKYGSVDRAVDEFERIRKLLALTEDFELQERELQKKREEKASALAIVADALSTIRQSTAKKFSIQVTTELHELGMPAAKLKVVLELVSEEDGFGPNGRENVRFEMAPNPGEGFKSLSRIASGGELSRVLLAMKGVGLSGERTADVTYLFDEVDAGIGGETAERVGVRLSRLAKGRQVLSVTHLAQIACYADTHLRVEKSVRKGRTAAVVRTLDRAERASELARMIGGIEITEKAREHARELLHRAVAP